MKRIGLGLIALAYMAVPAISQIISIPLEHTTIQAGINAAIDGDTVLVAEGIYVENINFRGKAITVASQFILDGDTSHISKTTIDGSNPVYPDSASTVTMLLARDTTSILCGFTIKGGSGTGPFGYPLDDQITSYSGGGIILAGGKIINNIVRENHINHSDIASGGGIAGGFVEDLDSDSGVNIVVRDNIVTRNSTHTTVHYSAGAGIQMGMDGRFTLIENNKIYMNTSTTDAPYKAFGGGVNCGRMTSSTGMAIIRNNYIHDNEVHSEYSFGGGLFYLLLFDSPIKDFQPLEIYNNLIVGNHSDYRGGGACFWYIGIRYYKPPVDPVLTNNTIVDNFAETGSGLCAVDAKVALFNNILWNELADEGSTEISDELFNNCGPMPAWCRDNNSAIFHAAYNNIQGGWPGEGNINTNPLFMEGTLQLSEKSPSIGRNIDSVQLVEKWYYAPRLDFFGNTRPHLIDKRVDYGAIESPYEGFVYIPDTAFLFALIDEGVDSNTDSLISFPEAEAVISLDVSRRGISELTGIEAFVNLDSLNCFRNALSNLNITKNYALKHLNCYENDLMSLDFSNNMDLEELSMGSSNAEFIEGETLIALDLSNHTKLKFLDIHCFPLSKLDVSGCTALIGLQIYHCSQMTSLDASGCTALPELGCEHSQLTSLNLTGCKALTYLSCAFNKLSKLDISSCTELVELDCYSNSLTDLDVSACTALEELLCGGNLLTSLDVSKNAFLKVLCCGTASYTPWGLFPDYTSYGNQLTNLDVSKNRDLHTLSCDHNKLISLDVSNNTGLYLLQCNDNELSSLDVSNNPELTRLICGKNKISELDISVNSEIGTGNNFLELLPELGLKEMPTCSQVCVWDSFYEDSVYVDIDTSGSPNIFFTTECTIDIEETGLSEITIYPNPTNGMISITMDNSEQYFIEITSMNGQMIHRSTMVRNTHQIDLSSFQKGVYLISIGSKDSTIVEKIIKL